MVIKDSLDTNLIVHYIIGEPISQRRQVQLLLDEPNATHHISDLAIAEAIYVLSEHYEQTREQIVAELEMFFGRHNDVLNYNRGLFALVFPYFVSHPALSFNDCCMAFYAELNGAEPLWTFDKRLANQHPSAKKLG